MVKSSTEELTKIGSICGVYFLVQAYGYSAGIRKGVAEFSINEAVVFGFHHLAHILRPWDEVAWPLTPVIGLPLLLISLYLPQLLRYNGEHDVSTIIRLYLSLLLTILLFAGSSGILGPDRAAVMVKQSFINPPQYPIVLPVLYLAGSLIWFFLFYKVLFRNIDWLKFNKEFPLPWPELMGAIAIGIILFAVYLGSEFDGAKDSLIHIGNNPV